jgi:hypothetical protein
VTEQLTGVRLAEARNNRHIPQPRISAVTAFYGILLRHDHGKLITEAQLLRAQGMMIREGMLDELQPLLAQAAKESAGVADGCNGVNPLAAELLQQAGWAQTIHPLHLGTEKIHPDDPVRCETIASKRGMLGSSSDYGHIDGSEPLHGFPERSGWQQSAVTKPSSPIDDDDLAISRQTQMLQTIIRDDDIYSSSRKFPCSGYTVLRHNRVAPGKAP